jgi:hypothetical protein
MGKFRRLSHPISKFHYWFLRIILKGKGIVPHRWINMAWSISQFRWETFILANLSGIQVTTLALILANKTMW